MSEETNRTEDTLVDINGNPVEGLPASYDNIDENGRVLYLDEERRTRKEQPDKLMWKNRGNGIGVKNFLVTHTSARQWNWGIVLKVFAAIVKASTALSKPGTLGYKLYRRAMLFDPPEDSYSFGTAFNLNADIDDNTLANQLAYKQAKEQAEEEGLPVVTPQLQKEVQANMKCDDHRGHDHDHDSAVDSAGHNRKTIEINKKFAEGSFRRVEVPMDLVKKAIDNAEYIGGMKECLCRAGNDCQNYPKDLACLFLNLGGKVVVDHGMAVELTKEEAYARVDRAKELGLTCQSLWVQVEQLIWGFRQDQMDCFLEICFCCPCCCVGFNVSKNGLRNVKVGFHGSGWTAVVDHDKCTGCRHCLDGYCPQDAVHWRASDGKMVVDQECCIGCGMCKANCPEGAIKIKQTMPMREDLLDYFREEGRLEIVSGLDTPKGGKSLMPLDDIAAKIAEDDKAES